MIQELYCATNTKVKAGQICAKIDPGPYQTVVDQGNADLTAAEARLEKDKTDLAHAKVAFERHEVRSKRRARKALDNSRRTYEQAQTQMKLDEATVAQLEAALHTGAINLGYTDIVSPIDGTVVPVKNMMSGPIRKTHLLSTMPTPPCACAADASRTMARSHAAIPRIIIVIEPPNESLPNVISPLQSKHPPGRIGGRF